MSSSSIWQRASTVLERSRLPEPPERVTIYTSTIRTGLGLMLFQSFIMAMVFSIRNGIADAWLIPLFTLLQVGWIWDKMVTVWARGYEPLIDEESGGRHVPRARVDESFSRMGSSIDSVEASTLLQPEHAKTVGDSDDAFGSIEGGYSQFITNPVIKIVKSEVK